MLEENIKDENTLNVTQPWLKDCKKRATEPKINGKLKEYEYKQLDIFKIVYAALLHENKINKKSHNFLVHFMIYGRS